jgi:thiol-disulfide isomerase/thioredoxin
VFVNFWATWCPPCRDEMPSMISLGQQLAARYPGQFKMIAVSVDDDLADVRSYFAAPPFAGPPGGMTVVHDADKSVTKAYFTQARGFVPDLMFPETYIVDKTGRLVAYIVGPRDWSDPTARAFLEALIRS